jgi:hypothetical protein
MSTILSTTMSTTITIQQLVLNALHKAATPVDGTTPEYATPEEARDAFIARVMDELFPSFQVPSAKEKKRTPKAKKTEEIPLPKSPEPAAAGSGSPKKTEEIPLPKSPEPAAAGAGSPKKKRAPMTEEAKAAAKAKREAKASDAPAKSKKAAKATEEVNLKKVDPTWRKHLKAVAKAQGKEMKKELEAELLAYVNRLSKEEFAGKKAEEHVAEFLGTPAPAVEEEKKVPTDLDIVEFNGQDYFVNPETKRVYEGEGVRDDDTGAWTSYKPVGYVGMAAFAEMKME